MLVYFSDVDKLGFPFLITSVASSNSFGILRLEAKPLPEPIGIIPNLILVLIKQDATSFIVPSPPQATI